MRSILALILLGASPLLFAQGASGGAAEPSFDEQSKRLEEFIRQVGKSDQKHPNFIAAQLDYAQLLARNASGDDCATRLPAAETHFKLATDNAVTPLIINARARLPVVGFYLEMARSRCSDAAARTAALQAALKNARAAVALYRTLFMYDRMAIMQFNVAQTLHDMGNEAEALKELQATLDIDRTFGFAADAAENFRTLSAWQKKEIGDADVTAFTAAYAPRRVTLKFGWVPARVDSKTTFDDAAYEGGSVRHTKFTVPMTATIRVENDLLVYEPKMGPPAIDTSNIGSPMERKLVELMARTQGRVPAIAVTKTGEFKEVRDLEETSRQMNQDIDASVQAAVPEKDSRYASVRAATDRELRPLASQESLTARAMLDYSMKASLWSGATLEQNAWVKLPLVLPMNAAPKGYIQHEVEAAFVRRLPCGSGLPADGCVELVVEAVPTDKAVAEAGQKLSDQDQGRLDYAATTRVRVVVDPDTLVPYELETLRFGYLAITNKGQRVLRITSDQAVAAYKYRK